jgi:hypothetical protein
MLCQLTELAPAKKSPMAAIKEEHHRPLLQQSMQ